MSVLMGWGVVDVVVVVSFETRSHYVILTGLKLAMPTRLALNS